MIDTTHIDLLALAGSATRLARATRGEYQGPCPFCGGRDRFRVWPDGEHRGWWCRQCGKHGDAITFVQLRDGCSFGEALRTLGLEGSAPQPLAAPAPQPPEAVAPPREAWQHAARALVERSVAELHGTYPKPLHYLHRRGFTEATIAAAQLGYQPRDEWVPRAAWGLEPDGERTKLWLPRGIVIPWFVDGVLWKLFIRRPIPPGAWEAVRRPPQDAPVPRGFPATLLRCLREQRSYLPVETLARRCDLAVGDVQAALAELDAAKLVQRPTKHYQVPGGSNCIYNVDVIQPGKPVILVEAALDALAVQQEAGDLCTAVAVGTTGGRRLHWLVRVAWASRVLVALDNDQAGASSASYWLDVLSGQATIWRPWWDDPAQMLQDGADVRQWIRDGLDEESPAERAATYAAIDRHILVSAVRDAWRAERNCYRDQGLDQGSPAEELAQDLDTLSDAELTALEARIRQRARQIPDWPGWEWLEAGGPWRATHPAYGTTSTYLHLDDCVKEVRRKTPEDQRLTRPPRPEAPETLFDIDDYAAPQPGGGIRAVQGR